VAVTAASQCPYKECACTSTVIDCRNMGLQELPPLDIGELLATQKVIDISDNYITSIQDGQLPPNLEKFVSHGNPLTYISDSAFNDSSATLLAVDINLVAMATLPASLLNLTSLTSLAWTNGLLAQLPDMSHMTSLIDLDLSFNQLTSPLVTSPGFQLPGSLKTLNLGSNKIDSLQNLNFPSSLLNLSLSANDLSQFSGIHVVMSHLQRLDLSQNPITDMDLDAFSNIRWSLCDLDISATALHHLPKALRELTQLRLLTANKMADLVCDCADSSLATWYNTLTSFKMAGTCGDGSSMRQTLDYLSQFCPQQYLVG